MAPILDETVKHEILLKLTVELDLKRASKTHGFGCLKLLSRFVG